MVRPIKNTDEMHQDYRASPHPRPSPLAYSWSPFQDDDPPLRGAMAPTVLHTLQVHPGAHINRLHALLYCCAILALLYHRSAAVIAASADAVFPSLLLLLSDLVLAFMWAVAQAFRWRPVRRREFPERLAEAVGEQGLPALDVFICTADPLKEPPASVASTALSVMGFDYPPDRLSVYVSDDGGSELTLFALMEAARFARHWLPFCVENGIDKRSPEAYFGEDNNCSHKMKMMYQTMKERVESVTEKGFVGDDLLLAKGELELFKRWRGFSRRDHPSIIQVLLQSSKDTDVMGNTMPNLVYVSREKSATSDHHYKAGALNALLRVSSIMTDAPVILTLDCDMYSNDPQAPRRALCYLLDPALASRLAFVQFPQSFSGLNKNDIYAGEIKRLFRINARGMDGLRGPNYVGTGCFHSRRSFYGAPSSPPPPSSEPGDSMCSETVLRRAHEASSCAYELGTKWGSTIGFRYGSLVEDFHTSYQLHCEGWVSLFCDPERPAFLGEAPKSLLDSLGQCKRWTVGLCEVSLSRYSPLTFGTRRASLLVGSCYTHYSFWGAWSIPLTTYAIIPQLALTYGMPLFPKLSDPWFYLYAYLFLAAYSQDLMEFVADKGTVQRWWSDQRMWMIRGVTAFPFGVAQFALNQMGISAQGFNVTSKVIEEEQSLRYDKGIFEFGVASPFFVSMGTVAVTSLASLVLGIVRATRGDGTFDRMFVQLFLSGFIVANCWPVYEAMFVRRDGGGMPQVVTSVSIFIAGLLHFIGYFMFVA